MSIAAVAIIAGIVGLVALAIDNKITFKRGNK